MTYAAACTQRIRLGCSVFVSTLHSPVHLAKSVSTLDQLSHGRIEVGARTSVQDGTVVHCTHNWPTLIGAECVVGHNAHLEGCIVADRCLIGSGSVTLNGVTVGTGAVVAASCLVPEGFEVPPGALVAGVPGRIKKLGLTGDWVADAVKIYVESGRAYLAGLRRLDPDR